jgi:molybdenum cofactor cytidylyltransferase
MEAIRSSRIGAVVLAAGMSKRMGQAKQLLRLNSGTLLEQAIRNVSGASVDEIVLVLGFAAEQIYAQYEDRKDLRIVVNESYALGMASSLHVGLAALEATIAASLIVLADQPLVRSATIDRIIEEYRRTQAQIVIPMYRGFRGNPVLLDRSVFPEVMALQGDIGCRAIFGSHLEGIVKVEVEDAGILLDVDSKEDYERLLRQEHLDANPTGLAEPAMHATSEGEATPKAPGAKPELVLIGTEPVALALITMGNMLDFAVTVVDPLSTVSDLPGAMRVLDTLDLSMLPAGSRRCVVVASRGKFDEEGIEQALRAGSSYVALVANKKRGQEVLQRLEKKGQSTESLATVHIPAGLDIGAQTPQEIALSILAEIISERRKDAAGEPSRAIR